MRRSRLIVPALLVLVACATGCNRGVHPAQPGERAPDFTVSDGSTTVHLASYRGHVVLLNFWATWCPPCVAEMPSLLELHQQDPSLVIVAVSVDQNPAAYSRFLASHHIDLVTVRDPSQKAARLFHSHMWPETYLIDREGFIRSKFVGAQDWTSPEMLAMLKSL
ncbi:MAG: TlpA family protein disulfide reductase [Terracidiphilus sp.]